MRQKIVREGNAFYEIDDECMRKRRAKEEKEFQPKDSTSSKKEH